MTSSWCRLALGSTACDEGTKQLSLQQPSGTKDVDLQECGFVTTVEVVLVFGRWSQWSRKELM